MSTNTPKIFGQLKPPGPPNNVNMLPLYFVGNNTRAQVTIFVCNQGATPEFFRIALVRAGDTVKDYTYIAYDSILAPNGVFSVSGIGVDAGDAIYVKSSLGQSSFTATGILLS